MYEIEPNDLIEKTAEELKKIEAIKPTEWANFVKTGANKERPPQIGDWWYVRAAAILRVVRRMGPIGVQKLRVKYGSKKRRGHKMGGFYKGSGNIIRKILQQLEKAELIKKGEKGVHKGRVITPEGISILDKVANSIIKTKPKKLEKPKAEEKKPAESPVKIKEKKPDIKTSDKPKEVKKDQVKNG